MKFAIILCITTAACVGLFWFAHYSPEKGYSFRKYTLAEIYGEFLSEVKQPNQWRKVMFVLAGLAGMFACFYPPVCAGIVRFAPADRVRVALAVSGIVALAGVGVTLVMMLISQMNFSFGGSSDTHVTVFFWLIPAFHGIFAMAGVAGGISATVCGWLHRLVG